MIPLHQAGEIHEVFMNLLTPKDFLSALISTHLFSSLSEYKENTQNRTDSAL